MDAKGDYDSSLKCYDKALENSIKIMGGDYTRSLESYEKALIIWKKAYGEDHRKVASCLNNMGGAYQEEKKYIIALEFYQKALGILAKHLPADHHLMIISGKFDNVVVIVI
jgi:tetratricopeptide (TPR) repeat protein